MQTRNPSLFARDDTFLGVCEGLGQDFGFPPNLLRVTLAVLLFFSPKIVIGSYLAVGVAMMIARWAFPDRQPSAVRADVAGPINADNDAQDAVTALAA